MSEAEFDLVAKLHKRIAELEAEVARRDDLTNRWVGKCAEERARAEKAEARLLSLGADLNRAEESCRKAEAEVERLRAENRAMWEALGRPLSVSPSPPSCAWCGHPREKHRNGWQDCTEGMNYPGCECSQYEATPKTCEFCGGPEHRDDSECPAWTVRKERDDG